MIAFADNFLAGSLLSLLLPALLLAALAVWFHRSLRHIPEETPESSATLPPPEVVAAAGPDVHELTPIQRAPGGPTSPGGSSAVGATNDPGAPTPPERGD